MRSLKRWRRADCYDPEYQRNPIKPKNLEKRLQFLINLGLDLETTKTLAADLSNPAIDTSQAEYLLDWWRARLSLIAFFAIDDPEPIKSQKQNPLTNYLMSYCSQYQLTPYDLALDGELSLDIYPELRHFIELSITNPYFRTPWPLLHYVTFEEQGYSRNTVHHWLGYLAKDNIKLSQYLYGHGSESPAIQLLRGQYMADPVGFERETEIPKEAITSLIPTGKPSDLIKFLKEGEADLKTARYFVPEVHQPFLSFPDGKSWVIIDSGDVEAEARSLGDCGRGQYAADNIVLLSLREPVVGKYQKALLKAEIVFPTEDDQDKIQAYEDIAKQKYGIINQLRGYANSKPPKELHPYIVPLLEQSWIAQNVDPDYRSDHNFQLRDLTEADQERLKQINPRLFNLTDFYQEFKKLTYPTTLRNQIVDRMSFDIPDLIQMLGEMGASGGTLEDRAIEAGLKKRILNQEDALKDEVYPLLSAAEEAIFRLKTPAVTKRLVDAGAELSITKILTMLDAVLAAIEKFIHEKKLSVTELWKGISHQARQNLGWENISYETFKSYFEAAMTSLHRKIVRGEGIRGIDEAQETVGKILLNYGEILKFKHGAQTVAESIQAAKARGRIGRRGRRIWDQPAFWPPSDDIPSIIVGAKIGLSLKQTQELLRYFINLSDQSRQWWIRLTVANNYLWRLLLLSLEGNKDPILNQNLKELLLHPTLPFEPVRDLLMEIVTNKKGPDGKATKAIISEEVLNFSEEEIVEALSEGSDGAMHAVLLAVKKRIDAKEDLPPKIQKALKKLLYRIKSVRVADEAIELIEFPLDNLLDILQMKKVNRYTRLAAIKALRKRLTKDQAKIQKKIYQTVQDLVLTSTDKNLIRKCLDLFSGFQHQYQLFQTFAEKRINWVSAPENRTFILKLIRESLPKSKEENQHFSACTLPSQLGQFLQKLVSDNLINNNCEFLLTVLFDVRFDDSSQKNLTRLAETILDAVIANPEKLTSDFCYWMENEAGGWGSRSQRWFPNHLRLTGRLLKQFYSLTEIAERTRNDCYLKLVLAIGHNISSVDKPKLGNLVGRWTKGMLIEKKEKEDNEARRTSVYGKHAVQERLRRLLGLRRQK